MLDPPESEVQGRLALPPIHQSRAVPSAENLQQQTLITSPEEKLCHSGFIQRSFGSEGCSASKASDSRRLKTVASAGCTWLLASAEAGGPRPGAWPPGGLGNPGRGGPLPAKLGGPEGGPSGRGGPAALPDGG